MNKIDQQSIHDSCIDISKFDTNYSNGVISLVNNSLLKKFEELVIGKDGYAVCYNVSKVMLRHGLDISNPHDAEIARQFLEDSYREFAGQINLEKYSPVDATYDRIVKMDVDGFKINKSFSPNDEHTPSREFTTTKCVHFDAATPFIANIYGPNKNIANGHPIICNTRKYCQDTGTNPFDLVENIPNNYNVVVKEKYYQDILDNYSFGLDINMTDDLIMIVLYNEVNGGVAHAATPPNLIAEGDEIARPIRHIEYQFKNAEDLSKWYQRYNIILSEATDHDASIVDLSLSYGSRLNHPFNNFVKVND